MYLSTQTLLVFSAGFACCLLLVALFTAKGAFTSTATIPQVLSYHGNLTDANGVPIQGVKTITFWLYDAPSGGVPIWPDGAGESHLVTLEDGVLGASEHGSVGSERSMGAWE